MNRLLLPAALLLAMAATPDAAVLFQDNFTVGAGGYAAGSIYQQNPALAGFPTPASSGWSYNTGVFSDAAGSVTLSGLTVGSARVTHRAATYTPSGSDLWFSYQGSTTALANGTHTGAGLLNGSADNATPVPGGGGGTGYIWGGNSGAQGSSLSGFMLGFAAGSGGSMTAFVTYQNAAGGTSSLVTQTFGSLSANTTYQFITQLSLDTNGADDTLNVWVVAAGALPSALGAPMFTVSGADIAGSLSLADLTMEAGNEQGGMQGTSTFDNMIGADSYSDMVAAPEPAAAALLPAGLGAVLLARRVFRRREALPVA